MLFSKQPHSNHSILTGLACLAVLAVPASSLLGCKQDNVTDLSLDQVYTKVNLLDRTKADRIHIERIQKTTTPLVVLFSTQGCEPCHMLAGLDKDATPILPLVKQQTGTRIIMVEGLKNPGHGKPSIESVVSYVDKHPKPGNDGTLAFPVLWIYPDNGASQKCISTRGYDDAVFQLYKNKLLKTDTSE